MGHCFLDILRVAFLQASHKRQLEKIWLNKRNIHVKSSIQTLVLKSVITRNTNVYRKKTIVTLYIYLRCLYFEKPQKMLVLNSIFFFFFDNLLRAGFSWLKNVEEWVLCFHGNSDYGMYTDYIFPIANKRSCS